MIRWRGMPGAGKGMAVLAAGLLVALPAPFPAVSAQERDGSEALREVGPPGAGTPIRRPVPGPLVPPGFYRAAVEAGTRSPDGSPGPAYWEPWAEYDIEAELDPATGRVTGSETLRFMNGSPVALRGVALNLYQNLHAPGAPRLEQVELTGGVELSRVVAQGRELAEGDFEEGPAWEVDGTVMNVRLPRVVGPGDTLVMELDWSFVVPERGAGGRMGHSDREMYFVGYWFPRVAALDDLRLFDVQPFLGSSEFHENFGDYRVSVTVPEGWTVVGTGELQNPEQVLSEQTRRRLAAAATSDTVVHVVTAEDRQAGRVTAPASDGKLTWRFRADSVRDFTFAASDRQLWNSMSALVEGRPGEGAADRVAIHSLFRPDVGPLWKDQTPYGKHAVEHHSRFTGVPYPWPHMTSVEGSGIIGGGMEFPMLTVMGSYRNREAEDLYNVTSHEVAHMWVPMIVGTNEKRYAWMDEGFSTFLENQGRLERRAVSAHDLEREQYLGRARAGAEEPIMRHGDYYEAGGYGTASYRKTSTLLVTLSGLLGPETFQEAYRTYLEEWSWKRPTPWDFFNTVERVAGRDLDWFWQSYFFETWVLDQAVAEVRQPGATGGPVVVVEDRGFAPMPARLLIDTSEGGTLNRAVPVDVWLQGKTRAEVELPADVGRVTRVVIDPGAHFPDVDRGNNLWEEDGGG